LDNHKIYKDMPKHEASVLMQARTGCMGMAEFLFRRHVPDIPSPLCSCGHAPETPEHVLLRCSGTEDDKQEIRQKIASIALRTRRNLAQLTIKYPKLTAEWLLRTGRFSLYDKAQRLQEEWETAKLGISDQAAATGVG
jgi:hypothetical protein